MRGNMYKRLDEWNKRESKKKESLEMREV